MCLFPEGGHRGLSRALVVLGFGERLAVGRCARKSLVLPRHNALLPAQLSGWASVWILPGSRLLFDDGRCTKLGLRGAPEILGWLLERPTDPRWAERSVHPALPQLGELFSSRGGKELNPAGAMLVSPGLVWPLVFTPRCRPFGSGLQRCTI